MVISILFICNFSSADEIDQLTNSIKESKLKIQQEESEKRAILGALYKIHKKSKRVNVEREKIVKNMTGAKDSLRSLKKMITQLKEKISSQQTRVRSRMKVISKYIGNGFFKVAFSSNNSSTMDRSLKLLKIITEKDIRLLRNYFENIALFKEKLVKRRRRVIELTRLQKELNIKNKELEFQKNNKKNLLSKIDSEKMLQITKLKKLRLLSNKFSNSKDEFFRIETLEKLLSHSFFELKGSISNPVSGSVKHRYGFIKDEPTGVELPHKGVFYRSQSNADIKNVFQGTVKYIGTWDHLGNVLIISHGDNYFTLYGNIKDISLSKNQYVEKNQLIAKADNSSIHEESGLYFEIRHFSEPLDPEKWVSHSLQDLEKRTL